jgi:membrane protein implicated in regulation of membrane protease activity
MWPAVLWLIAGVVLIGAEVLSGQFVLLMLGGGALAAAGVSFLVPDSPVVGGVTFAIAAVLLLFAARPALRKRLESGMAEAPLHTRGWSGAVRSWSRGSTGTAARSASGASCGRRGRSTTMT